jgi:hypothetical protein
MAMYDEKVRFNQGSDSGEADDASIQPLGGHEVYNSTALNRPPKNLRQRVEVLRGAVETLNYFADYDRALTLRSDGLFSVTQVSAGLYSVTATQNLWLYPTLTPGTTSGGRAKGARLFVAGVEGLGTAGLNDLHVVADRDYVGQRGYADGPQVADGQTLSIGANDVSVEFVAESRTGGPGSVQIAITGTPKRHVRIAWGTTGGGTTLNDLITTVNADRTSQGAFGAADFVRLSTTSPGTTTTLPTCAPQVLQGGYDAEAHVITPEALADFFATAVNQLRDGEALALAFPVGPVEAGNLPGRGGRRQSLFDLPTDRSGGFADNTAPLVGNNLFNTGREPEKIPGSLPIGKLVGKRFVFIDGTALVGGNIGTTSDPIALGESADTVTRLTGAGGAGSVGFLGTTTWHADSGPDGLAGTNVQAALDEVVSDLAGTTLNDSGARRVGVEALNGTASVGNAAYSTSSGSVWHQLSRVINDVASTGNAGGLNSRVSEYGHRMHGPDPIEKVFSEAGLTAGGGTFTRVVLNAGPTAAGVGDDAQITEVGSLTLRPFTYDAGGGVSLASTELVDRATTVATYEVHLSAVAGARLTALQNTLKTAGGIVDDGANPSLAMVVKLAGVTPGPSGDGSSYYYFDGFVSGTARIGLRRLDGTFADFTGAVFAAATIAFFETIAVGNDGTGGKVRVFDASLGPLVAIRAGGGSKTLVRVYDPDNYALSGLASFEVTPNNAVFAKGQTTHAISVERNTNNISIPDEFALLNGIERGLRHGSPWTPRPVSANGSHHHGNLYGSFYSVPASSTGVTWHTTASNTLTLSTATDYNETITPPAGYRFQAVMARVVFIASVASAAAANASFDGELRASPGTVYASTNSVTLGYATGYKQLSSGSPQAVKIVRQILIPTDNNGSFAVQLGTVTNIDASASTVQVFPEWYVLTPLDLPGY